MVCCDEKFGYNYIKFIKELEIYFGIQFGGWIFIYMIFLFGWKVFLYIY